MNRGAFAEAASSLGFRTGSWRIQRPVYRHRAAPCHAACPAGEDAQAWLALLEEERYREAWEQIASANPLPAVTGRVCHHPCEHACNRGQYDAPVAIHEVERFLGDMAIREQWSYPVEMPAATAREIAVVGAGPAGCSAAYHLLRLGYRVSMFEALPEAGGLLRSAIPPYRLPAGVLQAELERLLASGMQFNPGQRLGRDFSLKELQVQYPAVFLGPGNQRGRDWNIDGVTPTDLHIGLQLLKGWMDIGSIPTWDSVAIVGAGNTAVDLARVLKFAGVRDVHIISHKAIPAPGIPEQDRMPAISREISQALEEGVVIHEHRGVQRLILRGEKVVAVEMVHMKKLPGEGGRLQRVAFEGTESLLSVEQVIPAIGQTVDPLGLETLLGRDVFLRADSDGRLDAHSGLFTGGDARGDHGTVSEAIGDGRRAALAMDASLRSTGTSPQMHAEPLACEELNLEYFEPAPRADSELVPAGQRDGAVEIEQGIDRPAALGEAQRCFSCGSCMVCDNCWTLCPDVAVLRLREADEDGAHYVFDYDYCKGCGLCAHECPCGFIAMEDEL